MWHDHPDRVKSSSPCQNVLSIFAPMFDEEEKVVLVEDDVQSLRQAWVNERASPELQPFEKELVERLQKRLETQVEKLEKGTATIEEAFRNKLYQHEVDRVKFILASYFRARLHKAQRFALSILSSREMTERLSAAELGMTQSYVDLMERHFSHSFLDFIPERFRQLTDKGMIEQPDLDRHVILNVLENVGAFELTAAGDEVIELLKGDVVVGRYKPFRQLLLEGKVELL